MKRIIYYASIVLTILSSASCADLDLAPEDYYGSESFWKSEAQFDGAVVGVHQRLRSRYTTFFTLGEMRGGLFVTGTTSLGSMSANDNIKNQNITQHQTGVTHWAGFYYDILGINDLIKNLNKVDFLSETKKKQYLGQAHGVRAFYYFWLYRTYGGVPKNDETRIIDGKTTPPEVRIPRSSPKEIMDFIKADIQLSEQYFENSSFSSKSQWTRFATLMLKAEVYLWSAKVSFGNQTANISDLDIAENALLTIQNQGNYTLQNSFSDIFDATKKESNTENIFVFSFIENELTNFSGSFLYSPASFVNKYDANGIALSNDPLLISSASPSLSHEYRFDLFQKYDSDDTRRGATFLDFYSASGTNPAVVMRKYLGYINAQGNRIFNSNIPIYRYSEVFLMLAEIANKKGNDPAPYLNEIRKRAYATNYEEASHGYVNASFYENELAILLERDKEFVCENKRWFDLLRLQDASNSPLVFDVLSNYGQSSAILNKNSEQYKLVWPIDLDVIGNNPLIEQNEGY